MKDLFSKQSDEYAKFRPSYPKAMVETLIDLCSERELVWDAGTGNGQLAAMLSDHFIQVHASDISAKQLSNAVQRANVTYVISDSTHTALHDTSVNLITLVQHDKILRRSESCVKARWYHCTTRIWRHAIGSSNG